MKYTEYVPLNVAIADVYDIIEEDHVDVGSVEKWASKAMEKVYVAETYEQKISFVEVKNYKACLPKGLRWLFQVLYKGTLDNSDVDEITVYVDTCPECGITQQSVASFMNSSYINVWTPAVPSTTPFTLSILCENSPQLICDTEVKYVVMPNGDIVLNMEKGYIAVAGMYFPINDNGQFLIPYDENIIDAIRLYCMSKIWESKWNNVDENTRESERRYMHYLGRWEVAAAKARGESKLPDIGGLENLKNQLMRLGPHSNTFWSAFGNLASPEHLVFDNSKYL
jgi:hypothetical protein